MIARARTSFDYAGTDYIYTLLRGYYRDNGAATGWNNIAYPNIGMPHILWDRQGPREATMVQTHQHVDPKTRHADFVQTTSVFDANGNVTKTETGTAAVRRSKASPTPSSRSIRSRRASSTRTWRIWSRSSPSSPIRRSRLAGASVSGC